MRDSKRIGNILYQLGLIWEKYPDLRLAQLIGNLTGDQYYTEDQDLINKLKGLYESNKSS